MEEAVKALARPVTYYDREPKCGSVKMPYWVRAFLRRYGIALLALFIMWAALTITKVIVRRNTIIEVTEQLTAQYDAEYEAKIEEFKEAWAKANFKADDESLLDAMDGEADAIARVIGTMDTKRMKLTMIWNILVRVDNPAYPNNVYDVIAQPSQWMFYDKNNPSRTDDKELALEQLKLWHEKRYPAGLKNTYVYGEWSTNDYVLRDSWEKNSKTNYWRFPE